ncbi:MAG: hypothetical protein L6R39_005046 [Caloplaca ligustica]|nr:MAG: hypothetical protein L6R39_005046 [Caloplaca ligustica]
MGAFWNSWQLWEKMCFLAHTHWKLRKYTALAKTKAAQKEEAIQRAPSAARRKKDNEVPFGVRAIESGIEVDGVWISRSNTPANSTPGSPALSANKGSAAQAPAAAQAYASPDRASTASNMSRLEIPQAAHGHPRLGPRSSTSTHTRGSSNPFERSVSSEQLPSRPASSYTEFAPRSRPSYQPRRASALRYSTIDTSAEALASLEGKILASKTGSKSSQESSEYESPTQRGSDDSWPGSSRETHRSYTRHSSNALLQPVPVKASTTRYNDSNLDSLADHRKSHAAETGQLFPRVRVNDGAGEWTGVQQPAEHRDFLRDRSVSPMSSRTDPFASPRSTPLMTPTPEPSRGAPSFEEFVRSTSPQGQYYLGEEGIPLQEPIGSTQSGYRYGSGTVHQSITPQANEYDVSTRKTSSFSEAV